MNERVCVRVCMHMRVNGIKQDYARMSALLSVHSCLPYSYNVLNPK